jgi:carboxylesterase type B
LGTDGKRHTISDAEQIGVQVAQQVGCETAADVLACLRASPAAALVEAAPTDYVPWVGGVVLPKSLLQLLSSGPRIPLLVGFDREEEATIGEVGAVPGDIHNRQLGPGHQQHRGAPLGEQIRSLYPLDAYPSLLWIAVVEVTAATDAVRGRPTRRLANTVAGGAPVWRYLYTHTYENDAFLAQFRASHIFEDPFLWGNFRLFPGFIDGYVPTPAEQTLPSG